MSVYAVASGRSRVPQVSVRDLEEKKGMLEDKMHKMLSRSNAEAGGAFAYDDEAALAPDDAAGFGFFSETSVVASSMDTVSSVPLSRYAPG